MSLVSYGASDESDTDDEITTTNVQSSEGTNKANSVHDRDDHIASDDDDFEVGSTTSVTSTTSFFRTTKVSDDKLLLLNRRTDDHDNHNVNSTSLTTLEDLPAPQSRLHTNETEETDLEEEVRPKASEIANAPKPPSKRPKQPVKITIPSLDEDLDDEEESKKKAAPSKVKSGLFSLLPAPVHAAKKQANRPLIPQSLTKKLTSATVSTTSSTVNKQTSSSMLKTTSEVASTTDVSSKRMTPFNALTGYDSDSDDDDDNKYSTTNFFSLPSSSEVKTADNTTEVSRTRLRSEEVSSSKSEINSTAPNPSIPEESVEDSENGDDVDEGSTPEENDPGPEPGAVNDAPLDFMSMNRLNAWSGSSYGFLRPVGLTGPVTQSESFATDMNSLSLPSSSEYNQTIAEVSSEMASEDIDSYADDDMKRFMNDKEFQKLQGKRKRGLDEAISFVDANVDDYVDPSEVTKYLTEETDYVSHKSKDNLPTAQQRRKKQITYLAYQAKERELELKNTWAQNRMTKKQTQSKYGF